MRERPLVLIVDDEDSFLETMSTKLALAGFDVAVAHNGLGGVNKAENLMPDLVLMDIRMPGMTGTDAALVIKQNPKTKDVKVAFLTNMKNPWPTVSVEQRKLSKALGMEDYIEKTEDLDVITEKVKKLISKSKS
jgi:CheY-like chemotaxis protein